MSSNRTKVAVVGVSNDYESRSVFYHLLTKQLNAVRASVLYSDIIIIGSYHHKIKDRLFKYINKRLYKPIIIFHPYEADPHDKFKSDFSLSFDTLLGDENNIRWPIWKDTLSFKEINFDSINPRFGRCIYAHELCKPKKINNRDRLNIAIFSSHLNHPRDTIVNFLNKSYNVTGFGGAFNKNISDHNKSGLYKEKILCEYSVSLAPENKIYDGYITEKIVESWVSGCYSITYADPASLTKDFSSNGIYNLYGKEFIDETASELMVRINQISSLDQLVQEPVCLNNVIALIEKIKTSK